MTVANPADPMAHTAPGYQPASVSNNVRIGGVRCGRSSAMKTITERFWTKVEKSDGCWIWKGSRHHNGYGYLHRGGHTDRHPARAHRFSWEIHNGPIPVGLWVLHRCDNPPCVRPDHLFLGTRKDNMVDCAAKGRVCTIGKSRMTECGRGHAFTTSNTYVRSNGHRQCRACDSFRRSRGGDGGEGGRTAMDSAPKLPRGVALPGRVPTADSSAASGSGHRGEPK